MWGPRAYEDPGTASGFSLFDPRTWSGADERTRNFLNQERLQDQHAKVQRESYRAPVQQQPVHITNVNYFTVDGQVIERTVTRRQTTAASRPSTGPSGFNLGLGLPPAGVLS